MWQFWIDRGGTFTDIVARAPDGSLASAKLLSVNPGHYQDATIAGIRKILQLAADAPIPSAEIEVVKIGTTVATNALLERKGAPTLLLVNRGLRDLLRIGTQQRPRLFDRAIRLPEQLYSQVAEVDGRNTADGQVLTPLDLVGAQEVLEASYHNGLRSVAVVFAHSYRFPEHETAVADLARRIGFTHVTASHEGSGLIKLVPRGQTAVVDAYLSPILHRYVQSVCDQLPGVRVCFMQSNGGLADARLFRGRNAILSGPAGGAVGAAKIGSAIGLHRLIGFDMGGTSTDVTHFDGELERGFETEISGISIQTPMMRVHTVAAGGGSICHFDGGRLRVGPASAGADPGPACYRRDGPLTVTDCNVALGRLRPELFPKIFGLSGDQALDVESVKARLGQVATGLGGWSLIAVAEGFLRIAIDNMAHAIKKVTLARGYDPRDYTLVAFGGAAGQHACAVAASLGIEKVVVPVLAGVLSAYGIGVAETRVLRQRTVALPLEARYWPNLESELSELEAAASSELAEQSMTAQQIIRRVFVRYQGSDSSIEVRATNVEQAVADFGKEHLNRYGFLMTERSLVVESVAVEGVSGEVPACSQRTRMGAPSGSATGSVQVIFEGHRRETAVYQRDALPPGATLFGPAIVAEANATTIIEPFWTGEVLATRDLILTRNWRGTRQVSASAGAVDPVQLEIFNNLFMAVAEQMGVVLQNTAYSINIKERHDYSCAVFDGRGRLIANAPHIPVHLGSMSAAVEAIIQTRGSTVKSGDAFLMNDPYSGGTHLPDLTVVTPVFWESAAPMFWVASRGHHADIGGRTPGSMPPFSQSIEEEGVLINDFQLVAEGVFQETAFCELLGRGAFPARNVRQNLGDIQAQLAANVRGVRELGSIVERYGRNVVEAYMKHVFDNAANEVRSALRSLQPGRFVQQTDTGAKIQVRIAVDQMKGSATVDFTGTTAQRSDNFNAPIAIVRAAVLYVFRTLIDRDIPLNDGCLATVQIVVPEKCFLNPSWPAAVVAGNVETSQALANALYGALGTMAAGQGTMNNLTFGDACYQYYETICGGAGAGPGFPGASAVHTHMTNSRLTDLEVLERRYPVIVDEFRIRTGSGGDGEWKGGDGAIRKLRFRQKMEVAVLSGSRLVAPFGSAGGLPGTPGRNYAVRVNGEREELGGCAQTIVGPGDSIVIETPGGGGYGRPVS
jgi:5-oxoprolinase (ATP-hydrolysing)